MPSPSPRRQDSLFGRLWRWYDGLLTIDQPKPHGPTPNRLFSHLRYALGQTRIIGPLLPIVSILSATASAIIPLGVAVAIDTFVLPSESQTEWPLALFIAVLIVAFVVPVLLEVVFLALMMPLFHAKFVTLMKRHMHKHLQGMSWRYFQNEFAGRIGTKINAIGQSTHDLLHIYLDQVFYVGTLVLVSLGVLAPPCSPAAGARAGHPPRRPAEGALAGRPAPPVQGRRGGGRRRDRGSGGRRGGGGG